MNYRIAHKLGRLRSGADHTGIVTHAVIGNNALCGNNPNKKSVGWSEYDDKILTCEKCLRIVNKDKWVMVYHSDNYYYWKHAEGFYNCTTENKPPLTESGYQFIIALASLKNEDYIHINIMREEKI
jgi:hypothetical protein